MTAVNEAVHNKCPDVTSAYMMWDAALYVDDQRTYAIVQWARALSECFVRYNYCDSLYSLHGVAGVFNLCPVQAKFVCANHWPAGT